MKTKLGILFLIGLIGLSEAWPLDSYHKSDEQRRMGMLSELGLPLPGSGIKLMPRAMLGLSKEQLESQAQAVEEMKTLGYTIENTDYPKELLNMHREVKTQRKLYAANLQEPASTHLRYNIKDLKLAFKFEGVQQNQQSASSRRLLGSREITLIGVVPQGSFHPEKGGWSGVAQFFDVKKIGSCSYGVMNVKASHTAAELAQEDVTYTVNNKATIISVQGSPNSGFIYKVEWFDLENFHELDCANMTYSPKIKKLVIALAKDLDGFNVTS
ncbi:MAG: hypothetical protein CK424_08565 [Legionella sp.]|nr:MAG: hypothetical protein CK424_08565 [Legionella sp.]